MADLSNYCIDTIKTSFNPYLCSSRYWSCTRYKIRYAHDVCLKKTRQLFMYCQRFSDHRDGVMTRTHCVHPLRWRHNGRDSVSNHQPYDCLLNYLYRRRSKKTSKLRVTGLCVGNSPGTGDFPAQMASNAENVSIWWRHHVNGPLDGDNIG